VRLQASNMRHDIDEAEDVVFTYPHSYSALEIVEEFKKALNEESLMQATYLALHPEVSATFFEGKTLWDKILQASKLTVFIRLYIMLKHNSSLRPLWKHDEEWHCFNGTLHTCREEDEQWLCQLSALQEGERVVSDLILYTYIKYSIWAGTPQ
jgi:hypothetical protein